MVEMLPYAMRKPSELSGGQQQRIALARALVKRPAVLLLDEPLGALDRKLRQQMQVELKLLQNQLGLTFVFVTHDQEEALAMSNSIAVMRNGRIEQLGGPTELYDTPATAFVAGFIGAQNFIAGSRVDDTCICRAPRVRPSRQASPHRILRAAPRCWVPFALRTSRLSVDEAHAASNRVKATVVASVMLGDSLEYVLRLKDGNEFIARLPRRGAQALSSGTEVFAHWEPQFFQLFPYEDLREARGV